MKVCCNTIRTCYDVIMTVRTVVQRSQGGNVLEQYVVADGIRYQNQVSGWRQAIDEVAQPLLDAGSVKPEYVQAIKDNVVQPGGTYMDVGSGVALAHARPEAGCNTDFSFGTACRPAFSLSGSGGPPNHNHVLLGSGRCSESLEPHASTREFPQ